MQNDNNNPSPIPDSFDRLLGSLHGLPDVTRTKPSTLRVVTPLTGVSQIFIVQTYRQREQGDTIFLESVNNAGTVRLAIPPAVAEAIARQRDALTGKVRSATGKRIAQERKDRGELPGFMKAKKTKN